MNKTILFDIIHPANVHYFKNTIRRLMTNNYKVIVTARKKEVTYALLDQEQIPYIKIGKTSKTTFGKVLFQMYCELFFIYIFVKFRPNIALSFGASYVAHNCFLFNTPHISFDDTEHATLNRMLYLPFTELLLTPDAYLSNHGNKHIKFPGHMELFYLNDKCFKPNFNVLLPFKLQPQEKLIFLRFVSWHAQHDKNQSGFSSQYKMSLVNELSKYGKVVISSEGDVPIELSDYLIKVNPSDIHHVLYYADLFVGEGATMASECAALGTPAIYVNSLDAGTLQQQVNLGLIYSYRNEIGVIERAIEILEKTNYKIILKEKIHELKKTRIDLNEFLFWLICNYPESKIQIQSNIHWIEMFKLT